MASVWRSVARSLSCVVLLAVVGLLLVFAGSGTRGLSTADETRYAEIAREMVESGDWITPRLDYIKHFHKPPLTYWLIAASFRIAGAGEMPARVPAGLAAVGGVLLVFGIGSTLWNRRAGVFAAVMLLLAPEYFVIARLVITDMILCFLVVLAYYAYFRGRRQGAREDSWSALFFVALGLGGLTKGPVVLVLGLAPILVAALWAWDREVLRPLRFLWGVPLTLAVALPWVIAVCIRNPGLLEYLFWHQTVERVATGVHQRGGPIYFFLPFVVFGFFPWTALVPGALRAQMRWRRTAVQGEARSALVLFLWFVVPLALFSLSGSKLPSYVLPLFPPLSLFAGAAMDRMLRRESQDGGWRLAGLWAYVALLAGFGTALAVVLTRVDIAAEYCFVDRYATSLALAATAAALVSAVFVLMRRVRWVSLTMVALMLWAYFSIYAFPEIRHSTAWVGPGKIMAQRIARLRKGDEFAFAWRRRPHALFFFLGERVILIDVQLEIQFERKDAAFYEYVQAGQARAFHYLLRRSRDRVFGVMDWQSYLTARAHLEKQYRREVHLLLRLGDTVLCSNAAEEGGADG